MFLQKEPDNIYDQNAVRFLDASGNKEAIELLKQKKEIVCHIYNVDKNCNECIKVIMEIMN